MLSYVPTIMLAPCANGISAVLEPYWTLLLGKEGCYVEQVNELRSTLHELAAKVGDDDDSRDHQGIKKNSEADAESGRCNTKRQKMFHKTS